MKKILIIDDNSKLVSSLKENLSLNHAFDKVEVIEAKTYAEASSIIFTQYLYYLKSFII